MEGGRNNTWWPATTSTGVWIIAELGVKPTGEWGPQARPGLVWLVKWLPRQWVHGPGPHFLRRGLASLAFTLSRTRQPLGAQTPVFLCSRLSLGSRFMSHSSGITRLPIYRPPLVLWGCLAFSVSSTRLGFDGDNLCIWRLPASPWPCPGLFLPIKIALPNKLLVGWGL